MTTFKNIIKIQVLPFSNTNPYSYSITAISQPRYGRLVNKILKPALKLTLQCLTKF